MQNVFLALIILLLSSTHNSNAQIVSSKIMDAKIDWIQNDSLYNGELSIYLTDTVGISGLHIAIGTVSDSSDLYEENYTISIGGNFWSNGTIEDNILEIGIGNFNFHVDYFAHLKILLDNGTSNEIEIHSTN